MYLCMYGLMEGVGRMKRLAFLKRGFFFFSIAYTLMVRLFGRTFFGGVWLFNSFFGFWFFFGFLTFFCKFFFLEFFWLLNFFDF